MRVRRAVASALAATALGAASQALAELQESSERLAQAWRTSGALVVVDKTRFLGEGQTTAAVLPKMPAARCTTVVFLGARGLGFHVSVVDTRDEDADRKLRSEAGAVSIERCGGAPFPRAFLLSSDSGRGAVETIVARSDRALSPLRTVLPERSGGAVIPGAEPGTLPSLPPAESRAEMAEGRARRDGASIGERVTWQAGMDGSGAGHETLDAGCHRLRLIGLDSRASRGMGKSRLDLDAEMRSEADDRLLARDRSDAPDAELAVCVGEPTRVEVVFAGSLRNSPVLVAHFAWPMPAVLPTVWGSEARARMAKVLLARHVPPLQRRPFVLVQGGSGGTPVPIPIEPGACYLAIVSLVQGTARAVALRVHVGAREVSDDRGVDEGGAAVAFCAREQDRALAHVELHGAPPLGWGLAVYRLESDVWEQPR